MSKKYRTRTLEVIHKTVQDFYKAGVMDARTMREFDEGCLTPVKPVKAREIRSLRAREGVSQSVFARYLGVTTGLVSQWERGKKKPSGPSLKLLALVAKGGIESIA